MRKSNASRPSNEQDFHQCSYCGDPAQFVCSKCDEAYYCKPDHQRADWKNHSKICVSYADRRKDHLQKKRKSKSEVFRLISKSEVIKAVSNIKTLIDKEKQFIQKYGSPDIELEIELGSTICVFARLLNSSKQLSQAQDAVQEYFKDKVSFLSDTSNISGKQELQGMSRALRERNVYLTQGKLRLLSALCNLMHELFRTSIDMFQILLMHFEKVYGSDSLELSNIYFYTANYLYFLKKPTKALACFLKCAKLRKNLGGTAYYNAAFLLLQSGRKKKALQFYQKALQLIEKQKNMQNASVIPQIYETIALIYMQEGMTRAMMDYFEKAYYFYVRNQDHVRAETMLRLFISIRKEAKQEGAQDMKTVEFAKQKKEKKPAPNLSSKNYENFKNADKQQEDERKRIMEWLTSFKQLKMNLQPTILKYPKQLQYLFGNEKTKNGDEQTPSENVKNSGNSGLGEGVFMDLGYMQTLSSSQVGYLHELNRLLQECKERAAIYDIVQNSNFYQSTEQNKINHFFKLNPQLIRPTDFQRMAKIQTLNMQDNQIEQPEIQIVSEPKKFVNPPKLDLTGLKNLKNI